MRVAFLLDRFPVTTETFVTTQIAGLLRAGCEVSVLARRRPRPDEPVHDEVRALGVERRTTYLDRELEPDSRDPVSSVPLVPGRHDILHAHFGPNAQRFLFARGQAEAPLVVTFHGHDFSADPRAHGVEMYDALFEVADHVTCNSEHARAAVESLGCPPDKLRIVRMPVDVSLFPFRERRWNWREPVRLVTVARLVEKKGHELALRALAVARDRLPDVSLRHRRRRSPRGPARSPRRDPWPRRRRPDARRDDEHGRAAPAGRRARLRPRQLDRRRRRSGRTPIVARSRRRPAASGRSAHSTAGSRRSCSMGTRGSSSRRVTRRLSRTGSSTSFGRTRPGRSSAPPGAPASSRPTTSASAPSSSWTCTAPPLRPTRIGAGTYQP